MRKVVGIEEQIRLDEGEKLHAYKDSLGYITIGVGRLIDSRKGGGISKEESAYLLANDIKKVTERLNSALPWAVHLDAVRHGVMVNMGFQLGIGGLLMFTKTLSFIESGKYSEAANEMLKSQWAKQTPERAARLALQIKTGVWQ